MAGQTRRLVSEMTGVDPGDLLRRCTFPPAGTPVDCAVSGGPDSLAMLALACAAGCRATAWHVDHGLRDGSADEATVVAQAAERFGADFVGRRVDIEPGPNLEARARAARRQVLPTRAFTGHTADDQAETVLLNLLRGAGLAGLAGMTADRHPILGLRRAETHGLCAHLGLTPLVDPTNAGTAHLRNRVRHELVPSLDDLASRDIVPILARQAALIRDDNDHLDALAANLDATDAVLMATTHRVLARRAVRAWLIEVVSDAERHPPSADAVERVLGVARGDHIACEVDGGWRVARHRQRLSVSPPSNPPREGPAKSPKKR